MLDIKASQRRCEDHMCSTTLSLKELDWSEIILTLHCLSLDLYAWNYLNSFLFMLSIVKLYNKPVSMGSFMKSTMLREILD